MFAFFVAISMGYGFKSNSYSFLILRMLIQTILFFFIYRWPVFTNRLIKLQFSSKKFSPSLINVRIIIMMSQTYPKKYVNESLKSLKKKNKLTVRKLVDCTFTYCYSHIHTLNWKYLQENNARIASMKPVSLINI